MLVLVRATFACDMLEHRVVTKMHDTLHRLIDNDNRPALHVKQLITSTFPLHYKMFSLEFISQKQNDRLEFSMKKYFNKNNFPLYFSR